MAAEPGGTDTRAVTRPQKLQRLKELTAKNTLDGAWAKARKAAQQGNDKYRFTWSTDYCSKSPDKPLGFNFKNVCAHHDFGYRNYKKLNAFSKATRLRVDKTFLDDMQKVCRTERGHTAGQRKRCLVVARVYYEAVRKFSNPGGA
ncbi:phospholipase [Streptomyces monticola]|uniref:Phospholipase n=1 Tax=Streptomyces monticola TaxID=2666263 RepID=A0ABW2JKT3_9ACTN